MEGSAPRFDAPLTQTPAHKWMENSQLWRPWGWGWGFPFKLALCWYRDHQGSRLFLTLTYLWNTPRWSVLDCSLVRTHNLHWAANTCKEWWQKKTPLVFLFWSGDVHVMFSLKPLLQDPRSAEVVEDLFHNLSRTRSFYRKILSVPVLSLFHH